MLLRTKMLQIILAGFLFSQGLLFTELRKFDDFSLNTPDIMDTDILGVGSIMRCRCLNGGN